MLKQTVHPNESKTIMIQNQLKSVAVALEEVLHSIQKLLLD
jgi:two-component system sensor histidine kinase/response regulator